MDKKYTSVFDVANWFLYYNLFLREKLNEDTDDITNLKLNKLLYYAQSASLALTGEPLFDEPIMAWQQGPAIQKVYDKYKEFGSIGITLIEDYSVSLDEETLLQEVYDVFGCFSAWGLRRMTINETPYQETDYPSEISRDKMKAYFTENYLEDCPE